VHFVKEYGLQGKNHSHKDRILRLDFELSPVLNIRRKFFHLPPIKFGNQSGKDTPAQSSSVGPAAFNFSNNLSGIVPVKLLSPDN